ncbi:M48 family metalloprotease [Vulcaniibacterium gelatinicum]|uniref:M48 family metalloprotease n=1 Tax=Vulcaniibacterium gelatinicum TaxID=2598725 RepID=UPI0015F2CF01|nr:M48 family metalloprotease [Vulcaniibacterium gelatinicum]
MRPTRLLALSLLSLALAAALALAATATLQAIVHKPQAAVYARPDFAAPVVATLQRNAKVAVAGQEGLWFRLALDSGASGYVRVTEVRMAGTGTAPPETLRVLFTGRAGKGRVSETAGVRGLDESDLRGAAFDAAQLAQLEGYRATPEAAAAYAARQRWSATKIAWAGETVPRGGKTSQANARLGTSVARGLLGSLGGGTVGSVLGAGEKAIPKSEAELTGEELALGPLIAGRVLGARPLWNDAAAQRRVNLVGRWVASQSARPELPWAFGIVDTPEVNAFAAPGGYVLLTRGLYELIASDAELAGVLAHEINHVVQRDHYMVIHKQEMAAAAKELVSSQVAGGASLGESLARAYVEKHGAAIMLTGLDREAEYRADEIALVYLARAGINPLAYYAVLQKMSAFGPKSAGLAQLYKTHPPLDERLDRIDRRGYGALEPYTRRD